MISIENTIKYNYYSAIKTDYAYSIGGPCDLI